MNKLGIFMNFWEKTWKADYQYYINKTADIGFDILEFQAQPLLEMTDEACRAIKKAADSRNVELSYSLGLNPKYDISSEDRETRACGIRYLKDIVRKIAVMEGELFSGVTYAGWGIPSHFIGAAEKADMLNRSVESMREVLKTAEEYGVTICVEAVNRFESPLINTAEEAVRYIELVDSKNVGVHLDTYHMNIEENSIGDAIRLTGNRLRHFHTGENNRNVPGRGHLNWPEIFSALREIGYEKSIVSEPFLMMGDEVGYDIRAWRDLLKDSSEKSLDREAKYLLDFTKKMIREYM